MTNSSRLLQVLHFGRASAVRVIGQLGPAAGWFRRHVRGILRCVPVAAAIVIAAGVLWTLGPGAGWVLRHIDGVHGLRGKDLEDALDAVRGRALALGTGLAALTAVYYTARNADTARRTFQLGEQGHVTERYTKAIEQLGSDKLDIRLGGIYALERIAADSARDHPTVMDVLTAFIREHSPSQPATTPSLGSGDTSETQRPARPRPFADIQAALTVIGRRTVFPDARKLDLSGASLPGADLAGADLAGADLAGADLARANLTRANLTRANLTDANLTSANLFSVNLASANLSDATLTGANLFGANLTLADLDDANLSGAHMPSLYLANAYLPREAPGGSWTRCQVR